MSELKQEQLQSTWLSYTATWSQKDAAARQLAFEAHLDASCRYTDPLAATVGYDQLAGYMDQLHQQVPAVSFHTVKFAAHHGRSVAHWQMKSHDTVVSEGVSFGEYGADGKLVAMTGFFEVPG